MPLLSTKDGYGTLTKACHWLILALFAFQLVSAGIMVRLETGQTALGLSQAAYYNWHKSMGLVALLVAVVRLVARQRGRLPAWAPVLTDAERRFIHRAERALYTTMFLMPVSGFVYVMAGGYGVLLFGALELRNPIGTWGPLAAIARWVHVASAVVMLMTLAGHVGLVLRHTLVLKDGLLDRMLPRR